MIILLDTSTPLCRFGVVRDGSVTWHEWQADRQLAKGLLRYMTTVLAADQKTLSDIRGIGVFRGPGSFTGLRIGLTVMNTLADSLAVPIVGADGDTWQTQVIERLNRGDTDQIVMPEYGAAAHITTPRK